MREASVGGKIVTAEPDFSDQARCPACGAPVVKRKRGQGMYISGDIR